MKALDALRRGQEIAATDYRRGLVVVFDEGIYTIYRVEGEEWTRIESFSDSSGDHTGAILEWLFSTSAV